MNQKGELFLCDFGNCLNLKSKKCQKWANFEFLGSSEYAAPEVYEMKSLQKKITNQNTLKEMINRYEFEKLDAFSLGVFFFVTIFKGFPFGSAKLKDDYYHLFIHDKDTYWKTYSKNRLISTELKIIFENILTQNYKKRIDVKVLKKEINFKNISFDFIKEEFNHLLKLRKIDFLHNLKDFLSKKFNNRRFFSQEKKIFSNEVQNILQKFLLINKNLITKLKNSLFSLKTENFLFHSNSEYSSESINNSFNEKKF